MKERLDASEQSRKRFDDENKGLRKELSESGVRINALNERVSELEAFNLELLQAKETLETTIEELESTLRQVRKNLSLCSGPVHAYMCESILLVRDQCMLMCMSRSCWRLVTVTVTDLPRNRDR